MALPPGITPKTVTVGIASFFDGSLAEGTATITAPVNVVHTPTNRPIFSSQMSHRFVDGETTFNLCPTDAPGLNRIDFAYKLSVVISGALVQPEPVYFLLPSAGPDEIDLDSLVTVPSSAGTPIQATVVTSVNGQTGDVTVTGGGGSSSASDLTSGTLPVARIADASLPIAKLAVDIATQAELDAASTADRSRANHTGTQAASTITGLATVATSGAYNDLSGKPTIPAAYTDAQAVTANASAVAPVAYTGTFRSAWAGSTAYAIGDVVTAEAGIFRAISVHTSNAAGFRYDRNFWESVPVPALHGGTSVPIRQVDQTNIGTGVTTPRAGIFQRPQKQFNYLAERVIWAFNNTTAVTSSGTSVTAANGTMPGGSVVLTRATGTAAMRATSPVLGTPINLSGNTEHLRIPVKITTAATSAYLNIYLSSAGATFTNALKLTVIAADPPPFGWRTYSIPLNEMVVQGTGADLAAINAIQIEYDTGLAGDKMEVSRVTRHANVAAKAAVMLWFDDGNLTNQSAAIDIATRMGLPVTLAHIGDTYTASGTTITAEKARYLQDFSGGQIAVHAFGTVDHDRPQDGNTLLEQMLDYQHFALALGLKGTEDAAYYNTGFPGVKTAEMELVARKLFRSARATGAAYPETLPPGDPLRTRAFMPGASSTFAGYYQPLINRAITSKGLVQLVWHSMNATDLTEFTNLCTYLDANRATVNTTTPARLYDPLCV